MTVDMWITLIILTVAIVLFITEWIRLDVVAIGVVVALMLTGILSTAEGLAGFSNSAVITITALFVVGGGIMQTGLAGAIGRRILAVAGRSQTRLLVVIMGAVSFMSGFMSNTGTVAVLLPAIVSLARSAKRSPAKLLMPMAFAASLGGAATLIGTPPNLIASDALREAGFGPLGFFDFTLVGFALVVSGMLYVVFLGQRLLPEAKPQQDLQRVENPEELIELYRLPDNLFRLRVRRNSRLIGQNVFGSGLRREFNVTVLEVIRRARPQSVVRVGHQRLVLESDQHETIVPDASTEMQLDDILIVKGDGNDIGHAAAVFNLGVQPAGEAEKESLISDEVGLAEVLLPPRSDALGKTIIEMRFGSLYNLTVLGISRPGYRETLDLKSTPLRFGDTLLVQGAWGNILRLRQKRRDFIVVGQPEAMTGAPNKQKAPLAFLVMMGMLVLIVSGAVPVATASMLAALAMVLVGCLSMDDAYASIDWKSIVLIAGMIPMSTALEKVGLVQVVSQWLTTSLGDFGPVVVMAALFIMTAIFTQVLSNTATTVLLAPIAVVTASQLGVQPHAFVLAVAYGASQAFASPVASPVNTMVMGAGNYRFSDYIKLGLPLIFINLVVALILLPLLFPLS